MNKVEVIIQNGNDLYEPIIEDGITWETERKGSPGKLAINVIKDNIINFSEGNAVRVKLNDKNVFYGFIFTHKRNKDNSIQVTCYDQLRYFKNKDTYAYENKTTSELIKMLANDFNLKCGVIDNTKHGISRIEEDKTLFDMILNSLDVTLENSKEMYVLYDDFGQITLKNLSAMKLDTLIDGDIIEDFDYSSSIDSNTYNKIKLSRENKETGEREIYISKDTSKINSWGVLQYFGTIDENIDGKNKADGLLKLYNQKTKTLTVKNILGDIRVRAGSLIAIKLDLGDMKLQNYMLVDKAKHTFNNDLHVMDLTLVGGEFVSTLASSSSSSSSSKKSSNTSSNNSSSSANQSGKKVSALFTAYYPANNAMEGGLFDAQGRRLNPANHTCAAPRAIPFGTKIKIEGTGTSKDGQIYTVTDRGGAITVKNGTYHFDLLMSSNRECNNWGKVNGKAIILSDVQTSASSGGSDKASKLVSLAKSKLGCKYTQAQGKRTGPNSFDCSGLLWWCYKQIGIQIPGTSRIQGSNGKLISKNKIQPGDLLFFYKPISHVGMYIGNGNMIHASTPTRGVVMDNINSNYYKVNYNSARRYL